MNVLCIDTSTQQATVALTVRNRLLASEQWESSKGHGEVILSAVDRVLDKGGIGRDQLDRVGVCIGPGGFTAVRVGLSTAKGIALGLGAEIAGVLSLRVIARACVTPKDSVRLCSLNAYRGDVYAAAYRLREDGTMTEVCAPMHGPPADVLSAFSATLAGLDVRVFGGASGAAALIGPAAESHGWQVLGDVRATPDALVDEVLDRFGSHGADSLTELEPLYLRASDAQLPAKPLKR